MKIALFSDIHANLPALEAFFADVEKRNPDSIYCLGDLVGYNIWPNEVVNEIRKRKIPTIAGKYGLAFDGTNFILQNKTTACLAQDACGIPSEKVKKNLNELSINQNASCTPGGGCC